MSNIPVVFDAEPHHILEVDEKQYHGGEEFTLPAERVAELVKQRIPLSYDPEALSRDALEELAQASGVNPDEHSNKASLAEALSRASAAQPPDHTPTVVGTPTSPGAPAQPTQSLTDNESEED